MTDDEMYATKTCSRYHLNQCASVPSLLEGTYFQALSAAVGSLSSAYLRTERLVPGQHRFRSTCLMCCSLPCSLDPDHAKARRLPGLNGKV